MRLKTLAVTAAAVLGVAGLTGAAAAAIQNSHVLTVQLPDGATARIRYFGDAPPEVRLEPSTGLAPSAWTDPALGFADPEFAGLERAMAEMNRQADVMFAQTERLMNMAPNGSGLMHADLGTLPPGASGYTVVSTLGPHGVCSRSVEYRSTGKGRPEVISRASGDCGDAPSAVGVAPSDRQSAPRLTSVAFRPDS